ncbi:MAG: cysteine synthase A [Sulfobacillus acidophilus]|uniref:Cysteine synthase n=1 Tax=Sulfobacillus acidophilus TaxID=53633 RepID=A0A2T2WEC3_9FIRM|nr:MAG: cysteine synthase A [Sulfobacillus acidophilus]
MRYESLLDLIGHTPLVRLRQASERTGWEVYGKWEAKNPGGSIKDRIAWAMIRDAEDQGTLKPGGTIIEPTSGNTGIGLAWVAASRGYRIIITMPETASVERRTMMRGFGAQLVLTPGSEGMAGSVRKAQELQRTIAGSIILQQFENPSNVAIHYETTGPEIWDDTEGHVDALVCGVGTGGTITGAGRFLREKNAKIHIVAVEPQESAVLAGKPSGPHRIQGIGAGFIPAILDQNIYDSLVQVHDGDAIQRARQLTREEGLSVGISSGAAIAAAEMALPRLGASGLAVVILPDHGERYLSTALFAEDPA